MEGVGQESEVDEVVGETHHGRNVKRFENKGIHDTGMRPAQFGKLVNILSACHIPNWPLPELAEKQIVCGIQLLRILVKRLFFPYRQILDALF